MERGVIVTLDNGALGRTQGTEDGIFGIIMTVPDNYPNVGVTLEPFAINSLADVENHGWSNARDVFYGSDTYAQIRSFYSFSGNLNRKLWVYIVSDELTTTEIIEQKAPILLDTAGGEIRILFISTRRSVGYYESLIRVGGIDRSVLTALPAAQTLAENYAAKISPVRVILDGYGFMGVSSILLDLRTMSYNRVAINLSNHSGEYNASQGLLAGRLAHIPVNESAGWVALGNLPVETGGLTSGVKIEAIESQINNILDKGYITFQKYPHKYGYFFCNPRMATALTDDYKALTDGRTIDKAHILAYQVFVNYVNSQIYLTPKGTLNILQVRAMEADIENTITQQMIAKGECSFVKCVIDPTQKVISTNELVIGVKIIPTATLELLKVKLGFAQSV